MHARAKNGNGNGAKLVAEAMEAAEEAGLRYISDDRPGYTRKAKGDDFEYFDTEGKLITDEQRLAADQASRDSAGLDKGLDLSERELSHSSDWPRCAQTQTISLSRTLARSSRRKQIRPYNRIRQSVAENPQTGRERFEVVRASAKQGAGRRSCNCSRRTFIRIGNEEYARENKSFGLTTMKDRHVEVKGAKLRFRFRGKSGRDHEVDVTDRRIAKIVSKLQDLPGQDLFQYVDDDGEMRDVTSQEVNEYLREITGEDFSAKDFRTWAGTVLTAIALNAQEEV